MNYFSETDKGCLALFVGIVLSFAFLIWYMDSLRNSGKRVGYDEACRIEYNYEAKSGFDRRLHDKQYECKLRNPFD